MINFATMKGFKFIILFSISILFTNSFFGQEYNQINTKDQRVGKWRGLHENGKLKYIGQFENGIPTDTFIYYFATGRIQTLLIHKSLSDAYATMFYDTGELMAKGKYVNRKRDSTWLTYGAENLVVEKGNYINGLKEGIWHTFYQDGNVSGEINYVKDLKEGAYILYFIDGDVKEKSTFEKGKLNGLSILYDTNGKKILKGLYKNGNRDKSWVYYKENQEVEKVLLYENGKLTNPEELEKILESVDEYKGNRKDVLEFEDLRSKISYE